MVEGETEMNGFTEPRASDASEQPGQGEQILTWGASQAMLPLVGRIASDVMAHHARLMHLQPELERLDRQRRVLSWPQRSRRYAIHDELGLLDRALQENLAELTGLGVVLLDASTGLVGFPTLVNDRKAYFSWKPGEDGLKFWNFADEMVRHPVPESWTKPMRDNSGRGKSRPQR
jgi:hypothetical protein